MVQCLFLQDILYRIDRALLANLPSGDTTHATADTLLDAQLAGTEVDVEFTTDVTGDFIYTGKAISNFDLGAETGTSVKYQYRLQVMVTSRNKQLFNHD
jgi:hypothetical protein